MTYPNSNPFDDDGGATDRAVSNLAKYLDCQDNVVHVAMHGLPLPGWATPEHQDTLKGSIKAYNNAIQHAKGLAEAMAGFSERDQSCLIQGGCVTYPQILNLYEELRSNVGYYKDRYDALPRSGGRNHAALAVAKIVLRSFRILARKITWGSNEGAPTTDYGRAVEFAMPEFGVRADWRHAARVIYDEHERRQLATIGALFRLRTSQSTGD